MIEIILNNCFIQHSSLLQLLEEKYIVHRLWEAKNKTDYVRKNCSNVKGMVTEHFAVSKELIEQFSNLEIISSFGVGYENIDVEYSTQIGIQVTNSPDVLTDDVADLAITLLISVSRGIPVGDRLVRKGMWDQGIKRLTQSITGKKMGIVGMGRIGQSIACRAEAFKLEVAYYGPKEKPGLKYQYFSDLIEMASGSDFLMVSCLGGSATRHLVNRQVMKALGQDGIIVNIARGSVVEESAMVDLLKAGQLGGAGLDVFENEPYVPEELLTLDNVVLQPHNGSATTQTRIAMGQLVMDNLEAFFAGNPVLNPVNEIDKI